MPDLRSIDHVVITPSRNECNFLPSLIESMTRQTIKPSRWVIVIHNSTDSSIKTLKEAQNENDWISIVLVDDDSPRKRGSQIAKLVNIGINSLDKGWDFLSKIDADMILPDDYFEKILSNFILFEGLGIASGSCYLLEDQKKISERVSSDHTRGGLKTYRRQCFDQIGGIMEVDGWDGIDNIMAQMGDWETKSFLDIESHHQRRTGASSGLLRGCFEAGKFAHSMRYFPPFIVARSIHRMARKPLFLGGFSMILGYLHGVMTRQPPIPRSDVLGYLRKKQKSRLKFWSR